MEAMPSLKKSDSVEMSPKPRILYTKPLSEHRRQLLEQMVDVTEVKALDPVLLPIIEMPEAPEWILATSPHALVAIREHIENGWGKNARWATVGFRSRDMLEELGLHAEIKADHAQDLIKRLPNAGTALYLCGKDRTNTIENFMHTNEWQLEVLETYWTQATHPQVDFNEYDGVVFFSPRNVDSVLRHNEWPSNGFAMAIGPTTAKALTDQGIEPQIIPDSPDVLLLTQQFLEIQKNGSSK